MNDHDHDHDEENGKLDCIQVVTLIYDYLDGELDEATHGAIDEHVKHCRECFTRAEFEAVMNRRIKESGQDKAPEDLQARLGKLIDSF